MFNPGYWDSEDLIKMGFKKIGRNVLISKNNTIVGLENICIGNDVRIDGYSTIIVPPSGYLNIGDFVHIGGYSLLSAGAGISMEDFSGISQGVKIYSKTDDYSGEYLTNPTVDSEFTGVKSGSVNIGRHVIIGSGTVILPKVTLHTGVSVGAQSLVTKDLDSWGVYFGSPAKKIKNRKKNLLDKELLLLEKMRKKY
ncbi:acyltransferase [Francisellaceae bacterium CB52]